MADVYLKMCNKWWDGYRNQPIVLIEDLGREHHVLAHHLKVWADAYDFQMEEKGGGRAIRPGHIVVTSNYAIEEVFAEHPGDIEPICNRFTVLRFDEPWQVRAGLPPPPSFVDPMPDLFWDGVPLRF